MNGKPGLGMNSMDAVHADYPGEGRNEHLLYWLRTMVPILHPYMDAYSAHFL